MDVSCTKESVLHLYSSSSSSSSSSCAQKVSDNRLVLLQRQWSHKKNCLWFCVCLLFVLSILFFFFSSLSLSLCIKDQNCFHPYLCPHHLGNRNASQLLGENIFLLPVKRWTGPGRLRILNPATGPCNLPSLVHVMSMFHLVRTRTCFLQHLVQCYDLGSEGFSSLQPDKCFTKMIKQWFYINCTPTFFLISLTMTRSASRPVMNWPFWEFLSQAITCKVILCHGYILE